MKVLNNTRVIILVMTIMLLSPATALAGTVFVSIPPQAYFAKRIAGDLADVNVLVMPGTSPHTYEPTPKQMVALSRASAYFAIGVEFEKAWIPRLKGANSDMVVIESQHGVPRIPMADHDHDAGEHEDHEGDHHESQAHDPKEEHDHDGILDPHIWLSTTNARRIAENTCQGFIRTDPANAQTYKSNLIALLKDIDQLDADIRHAFAKLPKAQRLFMVFHPSWGYFAKDYGLTQIAIESKGNEPSPRALTEIIQHGRELGISTIFVQPQFSKRSAEVIADELNANVVALDPLAGDWEQNMRRAALSLVDALN